MQQIVSVTFPFFGLVLCGYLAARGKALPMASIPGLNAFVLFFALPCMLYRFAAGTPIVRLLDPGVSLVYLLCALLMVAVTVAAGRRGATGWNDAAFGALAAAFPNSGFMGVPLLVALLGQRAAAPAIVSLALDMVVTSSLCIALSRLDGADQGGAAAAVARALKGMARNPLPWAILLGCLSSATGVQPWEPAKRAVYLLADGASPVALFTIGAVLARAQAAAAAAAAARAAAAAAATAAVATTAGGAAPTDRGRGDMPLLVLLKLAVHPALVFAVGKAAQRAGLPLDGFALDVLVLVAALPSASNVPILAERYGADAARIARVVLLTTAGAFVSFTAAVSLLT